MGGLRIPPLVVGFGKRTGSVPKRAAGGAGPADLQGSLGKEAQEGGIPFDEGKQLMPTVSTGAIAASAVLSGIALLIWAWDLALLNSLSGSDPAGNGMAQGFAGLGMIVLWVLLGILTLIAAVKGEMPAPVVVAALVLLLVSGVASGAAMDLLTRPGAPPFMWPIITPALVPPLVIAFCFWALIPSLRAALPVGPVAGAVWGSILILSIAIGPMRHLRLQYDAKVAAEHTLREAEFASLPADTPLWDLLPFLDDRGDYRLKEEVRARMAGLPRRQGDIETMLDRGDFPFEKLDPQSLDLDLTPSLCDKMRAGLRQRVASLVLTTPGSRPYADIAAAVGGAADAMEWLVGYDCPCDAESLAWEAMAKGYSGDNNWDFYRVVKVREPAALGRTLLQYPPKFSLLTPRAHLKAWLSFASYPDLHDQALAGARSLDHRTADAVEMLGDEFGAFTVLDYLPELDLDATPALCAAAVAVLHHDIMQVYRPPADDPRSFQEFLERIRAERTVPALVWLAKHGCDVDEELSAVESVALAYQDAPERAQMLAELAALHRKP
jgi:hypothetical protein